MKPEIRFLNIIEPYRTTISEQDLQELKQNHRAVRWLVEEANVSVKKQLVLAPSVRAEFYASATQFILLITKSHIPFETLIKLTPVIRAELCTHERQIQALFNETPLSLRILLCLAPAVRAELYQKSADIVELMKNINDAYQYLIRHQAITAPQFFTCLAQANSFLAMQALVNEKLSAAQRLPLGHVLTVNEALPSLTEKIVALAHLVQGVALVRRNTLMFASAAFDAVPLPDSIMQKIAAALGHDKQDEIAHHIYQQSR